MLFVSIDHVVHLSLRDFYRYLPVLLAFRERVFLIQRPQLPVSSRYLLALAIQIPCGKESRQMSLLRKQLLGSEGFEDEPLLGNPIGGPRPSEAVPDSGSGGPLPSAGRKPVRRGTVLQGQPCLNCNAWLGISVSQNRLRRLEPTCLCLNVRALSAGR